MTSFKLFAIVFASVLLSPRAAAAADGYFDLTWGNGGRITFAGDFHNPSYNSYVTRVVADPNGQILVGGGALGTAGGWWLGKLNPDGTPVPLFGESNGSGVVSGCALATVACRPNTYVSVDSLLLLPDGRIVVLAWGKLARTTAGAHAIDSAGVIGGTGVIDATWQLNNVQGRLTYASSLIATPSGQLLVGGDGKYSAAASRTDFALARLQPNLALDTSFNAVVDGNGVAFAGGNIASMGPSASASVLHAFAAANGQSLLFGYGAAYTAMRFDATGARDPIFGNAGVATLPAGLIPITESATYQDRGGRVLMLTGYSVVRMTANGNVDATFGIGGKATLAPPAGCDSMNLWAVTLDSAGRILVAGDCYAAAGGGTYRFLVARTYGDTGSLDPSFGIGGFALGSFSSSQKYSFSNAMTLDAGSRPIIVGSASSGSGTLAKAAVARLNYDLIFTNDLEVNPPGRLRGQ